MAGIITNHDTSTDRGKVEYLLDQLDAKYHLLHQKEELRAILFELGFYIKKARRGMPAFIFYTELAETIVDSTYCKRFIRLGAKALSKL